MIDYSKEECIHCGVAFYFPTTCKDFKKKKKETFYCPNGHSMVYTKSIEDDLREELAKKNIEIAMLNRKRGRPRKT